MLTNIIMWTHESLEKKCFNALQHVPKGMSHIVVPAAWKCAQRPSGWSIHLAYMGVGETGQRFEELHQVREGAPNGSNVPT